VKVDGPAGPKVLKVLRFDSGLWPLRVEVAAFAAVYKPPQATEDRGVTSLSFRTYPQPYRAAPF